MNYQLNHDTSLDLQIDDFTSRAGVFCLGVP